MPFKASALRRMNPGAVPGDNGSPGSYFDYATEDAAAVVEAANYFNSATAQLQKGDIITARMALAGTPVTKTYIVTSATGATTVTVARDGSGAAG